MKTYKNSGSIHLLTIIDDYHYLSVNVEEDIIRKGKVMSGPVAHLYYAPNGIDKEGGFDHHHITMTREEVIKLRDWFNSFLDDPKNIQGP